MSRQRIFCVLIVAGMFLCSPLLAYQLAMKDGRIVEIQKYRVENGTLFYTDANGKESSVPMADVDRERTKTLNAKEAPPLDLGPASAAGDGTEDSPAQEPSLGDAARSLRQQGKAHVTAQKHTFTDDDVSGAGSSGAPTVKTVNEEKKPAEDAQGQQAEKQETDDDEITEQDIANYYDLDREQTARGILTYAKLPSDTPFPDRDEWEARLFEAKQDMAHAYMDWKSHGQDDPKLREELRQKWNQFANIANEGIARAQQYLSAHPRG